MVQSGGISSKDGGLPSKLRSAFQSVVRAGTALFLTAVPVWSSLGCASEVKLFKSGGDIDLDSAPHGAALTTMGGSIHVGSIGGASQLKTMGGDIEVDSSTGSLNATTMAGNVVIHVGEAAAKSAKQTIELQSNSGQITLTLPPDFGATVDATLAYTNNQHEAFAIVDDLGLQQTSTDNWDKSKGTARKYIHAKGTIGDGRNHIVINTVNGNITVQRRSNAA